MRNTDRLVTLACGEVRKYTRYCIRRKKNPDLQPDEYYCYAHSEIEKIKGSNLIG